MSENYDPVSDEPTVNAFRRTIGISLDMALAVELFLYMKEHFPGVERFTLGAYGDTLSEVTLEAIYGGGGAQLYDADQGWGEDDDMGEQHETVITWLIACLLQQAETLDRYGAGEIIEVSMSELDQRERLAQTRPWRALIDGEVFA